MQISKKGLVLGAYSSIGNLASLVAIRWTDCHNQTYFRAVYREADALSVWSILSSLIILFSILYFCSSKRFSENAKRLGIIVSCIIMLVFFASIPMNYTSWSFYVEETGVRIYPAEGLMIAEVLLAAISGLLTATSFFKVGTLNKREKKLFLEGLNKIFGSLITATTFVVISGGILIMLSSLAQFIYVPETFAPWLVVFPLLFFCFSLGIMAWLIEVYAKIRTAERELSGR